MQYITGIGSRDTPEEIISFMEALGDYYCNRGYRLRSGGATGADQAFQRGWENSNRFAEVGMEIYLPWLGFNGFQPGENFYLASDLPNYTEATDIACTLHPAWAHLVPAVKLLHTRNVYQVLGLDLNTPSKATFLYAVPKSPGSPIVKGGTNTANLLSLRLKVPVFNLYYPNVRAFIKRKLLLPVSA